LHTFTLLLVSTTLVLAGCQKRADPPAAASAAPSRSAATRPPTSDADHIEVLARHRPIAGKEDLDSDPVVIRFDRFAVTKASFGPKSLDGATATIELDLTSIKSGSEERDGDLKAPEFLDAATFATATVDVANVKQQAGTTYTADATVACRGITKTYPLTFDVLATTADSVRIKGELAFSRLDFAIGVDPAKDPTERVDTPLTIRWLLTVKKT
jgi:polyisoprenoid-binding protein YceI